MNIRRRLFGGGLLCELTLSDSTVVKIPGSGALTQTKISAYKSTAVSVTIGKSCKLIDRDTFSGFSNLTTVIISNSVKEIGYQAFVNCSNLTSVTIGNGVTLISGYAFSRCSKLTSITIPNSVTEIRSYAFENCTKLASITIGSGVTNIQWYAFYLCSQLTTIVCNATVAPTIDAYTFSSIGSYGKLYVPSGSTGYDVWMGTGNYYLGKYYWRKVEQ